jgi:hypothetical protein
MVRIEDVTNETAEEARRANPKPFPFLFAPLIYYILIPIGLSLNYFVAYYPIKTIKSPTMVVTFLSLFYNIQSLIALIFWIAVFLHVAEALCVFVKYPSKYTNSNTRLAWTLQTFLLGFSSLGLFLKQLTKLNKQN